MGRKATRPPVGQREPLEIRYADPRTLTLNEQNPRWMPPEEMAALKRSLATWGVVDPIIVRREDGQVIGGHQRIAAAIELGLAQVPVVDVEISGMDAALLAQALNRIMGRWDEPTLSIVQQQLRLQGADLTLTGFTEGELQLYAGPKPGLTDPDAVPEMPEPVSKLGDLWLCGEHRLLCGDATKAEDVDRLMAGERAALFATDPPYGCDAGNIGFTAQRDKIEAITKDDLEGREMQAFLESAFRSAIPYLNLDCAWYLWHPMLTQGYFAAAAAAADLIIHRQIIWVKEQFIFGRGDYHWQHELCFFGWRQGYRPPFYGERNQSTVWSIAWGEKRGAVGHPTVKPVTLFEIPLRNHTKAGGIALDPFLGSGTTMIACERLGRRCYGMEIEPRYVDVAVKRWEQFTGREAQRG